MAEETVVKEVLTQEMVQAGAELTRRLDEAHLEVCASFWLYMPDKNLWRLIVASPAVRQDGPKKVYQQIQTILSKMSDQTWKIPLHDISVVEDGDPLIVSLRHEVARLIVWHVIRTRSVVPSAVSFADVREGNTLYRVCGHGTHSHPTGT